jgi:hypothetical protein
MGRALVWAVVVAGACTAPAEQAPASDHRGAPLPPPPTDPTPVPVPGPPPGTVPADPTPPPAAAPPPSDPVGPTPLLRLTRFQYLNTLRDLLGVDAREVPAPSSDAVGESSFPEAGLPSPEELRALMEIAETVAASAVERLPELLPCDPTAADEPACAERFIRGFGRRAWRRPLRALEVEQLAALYDQARGWAGHGFGDGIRVVVSALLQSPHFLYRRDAAPEEAPPGSGPRTPVPLDPHARAARLSYFLWNTMPDAELFAAAETSSLDTAAGVEAQARRMLRDPRARDTIRAFHRPWLALGSVSESEQERGLFSFMTKSAKIYDPLEQPTLFRSMERETDTFASSILLDGDGRLDTLLSWPRSYVDGRLAALYGAEAVAGDDVALRTLPARAGILTQASFLARHATNESHPARRGRVIYERLLCGTIPDPPAGVTPPRPAEGLTTRQRFAEHGQNACAVGCHALMDPFGFALESFDGLGRHRTLDAGQPVDTSGVARFPLAGERPFAGTEELLAMLAASEEVRRCFARQWLRFALGRADVAEDAASLAQVWQAFERSGFDVRELLVALTLTPSFLHHPPSPPAEAP